MAKRKMTESQLANLKPNSFNNREIAKKAQKKSVEKRKENKTLAQLLEIALKLQNEETGEVNEIAMTNAIIKRAIKGDVSAYTVIRDTMGQKPTDKQEITGNVNIPPTTFKIQPVKGIDEL